MAGGVVTEAAAVAAPVQAEAAKATEEFRNYEDSDLQTRVERTYHKNHVEQTYATVQRVLEQLQGAMKKAEQKTTPTMKMTLMDAIARLDAIVDESDPDLDAAQSLHAYQTAEALRAQYPDKPWLHLVGLIHDLGKVIALDEFGGFTQQFVVGDTFPLGCRFAEEIVFSRYFEENVDSQDARLNTQFGVYKPNCGLASVLMSFGHDEYLYQVLANHPTCSIPAEGLYLVRFHSFYAHHSASAYDHLLDDVDRATLPILRAFQRCDLYSKSPEMPPIDELKPYYEGLVRQYGLDGPIEWPLLSKPEVGMRLA